MIKQRNIALCIVFSIITFGIHTISRDMVSRPV